MRRWLRIVALLAFVSITLLGPLSFPAVAGSLPPPRPTKVRQGALLALPARGTRPPSISPMTVSFVSAELCTYVSPNPPYTCSNPGTTEFWSYSPDVFTWAEWYSTDGTIDWTTIEVRFYYDGTGAPGSGSLVYDAVPFLANLCPVGEACWYIFAPSLPIASSAAAEMGGNWDAQVWYKGVLDADLPFTISTIPYVTKSETTTTSTTKKSTTTQYNYTLTYQNPTDSRITGVTVTDHVFPRFNVSGTPSISGSSQNGVSLSSSWQSNPSTPTEGDITWSLGTLAALSPPSPGGTLSYALTPATVTAQNGKTLDITGWTSDGWAGTSATTPRIVMAGPNLVYSDSPECLTPTAPYGDAVEGIFYKQVGVSSTSFRLFLNHVNGTKSDKNVYYVLYNPSTTTPVTVSRGNYGVAVNSSFTAYESAVPAGQTALQRYLTGSSSASLGTIPPGGAIARLVGNMPGSTGKNPCGTNVVLSAIYDLSASGPVQVGIAVVNGKIRKGQPTDTFEQNPLTYIFNAAFSGAATTYLGTPMLPQDSHVRGTFPHADRNVTLPAYDIDAGNRYGWRLGDCEQGTGTTCTLTSAAFSAEYEPAVDTAEYDIGNYGVMYHVTVPTSTVYPATVVQALINPRGGSYAGVVKTSLDGIIRVPGSGVVTNSTEAVGIGRIPGSLGTPFDVDLMPPAGSSLPVAIVLSPAYIRNNATIAWQGTSSPVSSSTVVVPISP
jgi:hypothetical protein